MGEHWMIDPEPAVKDRYDVLFGLLRPFFSGKPTTNKKGGARSPELKEFGPAEL